MNFGAAKSLLLRFGVQRGAAPLPVGETGGSKGKGGGQGGGSPTRQGGSKEPSCTPDLIRGKDGETLAGERAKPAIPSAREGRSPLGFDLRTKGRCLVAAAVNQQGGDVTEGESCQDRDERLLVELARLGASLHVRVPNYLS